MAAAINNKHRSLIARESSLLFIFLHLPFPSLSFPPLPFLSLYPLLRNPSRFFKSGLFGCLALFISLLRGCAVLSFPPPSAGASLTPFTLQRAFQPSAKFPIKREGMIITPRLSTAVFSLERPVGCCRYLRVHVCVRVLGVGVTFTGIRASFIHPRDDAG